MGTDDKDSVRFSQPRRKLQHKIYHRFVADISENWQGASTVGEIDNEGFFNSALKVLH
jgi:hypothetical protein